MQCLTANSICSAVDFSSDAACNSCNLFSWTSEPLWCANLFHWQLCHCTFMACFQKAYGWTVQDELEEKLSLMSSSWEVQAVSSRPDCLSSNTVSLHSAWKSHHLFSFTSSPTQKLSEFKKGMGQFAVRTTQIDALWLATLHKMKVKRTSNRKVFIAQY